MNKKKLLIIILILLVIGVFIACFFVLGERDKLQQKQDGDSSAVALTGNDNWLTVDTISKLEELTKKNNLEIEFDSEYACVSGLPFADGNASYNYKFSSGGDISELSIGYVLVNSIESGETNIMEDIDGQELSSRINVVKDWITDFLDVKIGNKFYIFSYDGRLLAVDEVSSYQKILNGSAFLELRILDIDGSVWVLNIEMIKGYNIVSCIFDHYPADSDEAKISCNVAIGQ